MAITEFLLFVLTATLGGMFLCGASDLITIFVAPECFSLCSYLLSGYTKRDVRSNEATTKYLLMGGASSSILVHGFSWLYGSSGGEIELQEIVNGLINTQMYNSPGISIALIFITVGIGFKLSPAPSHQWTPNVYEGVRHIDLQLKFMEPKGWKDLRLWVYLDIYVSRSLVFGKSIPPLEDRTSYLIPLLEDCASYLDDKCLIGLQKVESAEMIIRMRPQDSVQNVGTGVTGKFCSYRGNKIVKGVFCSECGHERVEPSNYGAYEQLKDLFHTR
ncbi:hypothetical protein GIB67_042342 [Kingdonia uniflora]|uniref:NADH:quinone oxidoreductase/Mrp antiporter transmembrane domain-containing protein n=1 Tax=Kingdonia uniflora TaxID=39325 RepID=A0A7J7LEE3_9MAGN|nr:hypothetical protein GIB67_042342 [Kingdonia uniflora]